MSSATPLEEKLPSPAQGIGRRAHYQAIASRAHDHPLVHGVILGVAVLLCYFGLWNAYFTSDDFWMLGWVRYRPAFGEAVLAQFGYSLRPLLDANLWLRVRLFDLNPAPYYGISLLQHIVVTVLVYWLVNFWTHRRAIAFVSALIFGTSFTYLEVVTWITGSNYSLAAIPYLTSLALFCIYLKRRAWPWYAGAVGAFLAALLITELALSLPLILAAYHLLLGREHKPVRAVIRQEGWLHLPFWALLGAYVVIQLRFVQAGSSEAAVAQQAFRPGLHMITSLFYLVYLIVPPYVPGVLSGRIDPDLVYGSLGFLSIAGHVLAALLFWKGSPLVRFAIAWMYLTFLPYTLWEGEFAGAIRYRYLPSIGFALLLALAWAVLHDRLRRHGTHARTRWLSPVLVVALAAVHIVFVQVWVQRHVENSVLRRAFVTTLAADYGDLPHNASIYIEVPAERYVDLHDACDLIYTQSMRCESFVSGSRALDEALHDPAKAPVYWLRATTDGIEQVYPALTAEP